MTKLYRLEVEYDSESRSYTSKFNTRRRLSPGVDYDSPSAAMEALRLHAESARKKLAAGGHYKKVTVEPAVFRLQIFLLGDDSLRRVFSVREITPRQLALQLPPNKK